MKQTRKPTYKELEEDLKVTERAMIAYFCALIVIVILFLSALYLLDESYEDLALCQEDLLKSIEGDWKPINEFPFEIKITQGNPEEWCYLYENDSFYFSKRNCEVLE